MQPRELTADEWYHIRTLRSQGMTGYHAHRAKQVPIDPKDPTYVKGVGKTYHWPMGLQPDKDMIKKIGRRCPIKAAEAFLVVFARNNKGQYEKPRRLA